MIVRPGQCAVFVNEGQIADHFGPGTYTLHTSNIPILTSLLSLPYNFESPFKAEVYFIRTTEQLDRKWGTGTPVMMRDADFGMVRLRARGNYSYKVGISNELLVRFVGARTEFSTEDIEGQMRTSVVSSLSDALGELQIPALDLAAQYDEIGQAAAVKLSNVFLRLGFELLTFTVENISLPDEVNAAMDKRASVGALGGVMNQFSQMQAAEAMREAAANPGGAGNIMGVLMGAQLGTMAGAAVNHAQNAAAMPPPLPGAKQYFVAVAGQQTGPLTLGQLQAQIAAGAIPAEALVWTGGMPEWTPAASVAELANWFQTPPPLPGK